jgi:hypothetical protein
VLFLEGRRRLISDVGKAFPGNTFKCDPAKAPLVAPDARAMTGGTDIRPGAGGEATFSSARLGDYHAGRLAGQEVTK